MKPTRFDHVALGVAQIADHQPLVAGALGGRHVGGARGREFHWASWGFEGGGRLELIEPAHGGSFVHRFLAQRGPGVHHVTFRVPSLREACDRAEANGYAIVGYDDSDPAWMEAFLHPRQALGIVVQLAESRGPAPAPARWAPAPDLPHSPPPVRILGLRMRARSAERALVQWRDVLHGQVRERGDARLVFGWEASPLRLAVDVDPAAEEGPVAVEFESAREVSLTGVDDPRLTRWFVRTRDGS